MAENFPNLKKETDIQVQEEQRVLNKMYPNRRIPRHIVIKTAKLKQRILKTEREKQRVIYNGTPIRLSADFSTEMLQARREWHDIFKVLEGDLQGGRRVRLGDHLPPHRYIRNTSSCGTTPTEHLLNAGRRPQTSQKARKSPRTWVGQKKTETTETKE